MFIYKLFIDGGIMMWPLGLCSILAFAAIVERAMNLRESKILRLDIMVEIEGLLRDSKLSEAFELIRNDPSPMMNVAKIAIINSDKPRKELMQIIEDAGGQEIPEMRKNLVMINTIASIAPLIGMLGTVLGMIQVFTTTFSANGLDLKLLSVGISVSLITSATGLIISVPCLIFYNFFSRKIENLTNKMEKYSNILMDLLLRFSGKVD